MSEPISRLNAALEGRYRIERKLGEGGMATVYLADDLKHERKVALKVLKPELAAVVGAERFLAEIKTTANLQHPHILPLHDSGEADGFLYYVTPYIEGENLRDRINRERQLPVDEAVDIARKVAGALQAAHDQGVIHRDVKPANILLSKGEPLVADFGIALAVSAAGGGRMTETGLSLGTPYYMSPEQAAGEETITGATDTFSLGCVLYEMLSGEPPFTGSSAQAVLGKILSTESVSVRQARSATPPNVDAAIRRCLERLPADRFSSIGAVATALANPAFRHGVPERSEVAAAPVNRVLVATTVALAAALGWVLLRPPGEGSSTSAPLRTYSLAIEPGRDPSGGFDISDDGRLLTYAGLADTEGVELFVRELGELQLRRLRGTAPGGTPAISPDGGEIAYFGGGELRIVSVAGGEPRRLTDALLARPDWGPDGSIYFVGPEQGIARIGREGGVPEVLVQPDPGSILRTPHLIAGTDILLYTRLERGVAPEIRSLNLSTGEARTVVVGTSPTVTSSGHLLYGGSDGLMAAPFDVDEVEVVGDAALVVPDVTSSPLPYYQVSDNGLLVYWSGTFSDEEFVWVDRLGAARPVERGWSFNAGDANQGWDLSPDGRSIVFRAFSDGGYDLWIKEVDGGPPSRLTFDPAPDERPHWSPDGEVVTFVASREEGRAAWQIRADGTGAPELIAAPEAGTSTAFWAPGDDRLVLRTDGTRNTRGGRDILMLRPGSDEPPSVIAAGSGDETGPVVSVDGRWIAYVSDETGRFEVFVRPFPDASGGRWQVTSAGGTMPLWAHNGRELFYVDLEHRVVQVSFDTARGFRVTGERVLFPLDGTYVTATYRWTAGLWDITPDDERFLMVRRRQRPWEERAQLIVVENFFDELERRVPRR